jgi:ketosteroid isomerase-like protein
MISASGALATLLLAGAGAPADNAAAREAIRQADVAMAQAVAARDKARLLTFLADDVVAFRPGPIVGRDAFLAHWTELFDESGATLTWTPATAEVFESGTLGFTTGTFEWKGRGKDGAQRIVRGEYLTIWRRQADGAWKAAVDIGAANNPSAP